MMSFKGCVFIKSFLMFFIVMSLASCVSETTKPDVQVKIHQSNVVDIDSDIEEYFNEASVLLRAEKYDEAIQLLEKIVAVESRVSAPFINLGMAYQKKGNDKKAEKNLLMAVNIDLTNPVANNQLGLLYRKKGRFSLAKKAYTNALTEYPDYLPVIKNLGILCELYLRDFSCALQQFEHYLDLQPENKTMKIWVADLSRRMK